MPESMLLLQRVKHTLPFLKRCQSLTAHTIFAAAGDDDDDDDKGVVDNVDALIVVCECLCISEISSSVRLFACLALTINPFKDCFLNPEQHQHQQPLTNIMQQYQQQQHHARYANIIELTLRQAVEAASTSTLRSVDDDYCYCSIENFFSNLNAKMKRSSGVIACWHADCH
ncbi:unnamed protein product [Ceratitis capitata]|uniref:(Mediterranean fruit fly) hypothetical protein n=1 Tax=Ceratitis capitata TaxID=7213 RepID=A0A811UWF1_CERCA|nr:unnamed protein product [Ceratitis capitata]